MTYGLKSFRKVQISNPEGTPGTAEAATEILHAMVSQVYTDKVYYKPLADRAVLAMNYEAQLQVSDEVEVTLEGDLYDRLAVHMFSNAIRGNVTPTQPDNVNEPLHYLWTFEPSLVTNPNTPDATNGIDTFTVEYGDNIQAYEVEYLFAKSIEITQSPNEQVTFSWVAGGRQVTEASFTGSLSAPSAVFFPANQTKFYVDTSYAGLGGTQKTGMLLGFTWSFETMFEAIFAADGNLYFSALKEDAKKVDLELTLARDNTNTEALKDIYEAGSLTYIRIELNDSTEMDSGQSNPEYIRLDGAYRITEWGEVDDDNGLATVTITLESWYDPTSSKMMSVLVGTTMSAYAA